MKRIRKIIESDTFDNYVISGDTENTNIEFEIIQSMYGHRVFCSPFLTDNEGITIISLIDGIVAYARKEHTYYNWCQVAFNDYDENGYSYFCDFDNVKPGDLVIVPVGDDNVEKEARVVNFLRLAEESLPYPASKTKKVIRVVPKSE